MQYLYFSKSSLTLFISLYLATKVCLATSSKTPKELGELKVAAPLPALTNNESECP